LRQTLITVSLIGAYRQIPKLAKYIRFTKQRWATSNGRAAKLSMANAQAGLWMARCAY